MSREKKKKSGGLFKLVFWVIIIAIIYYFSKGAIKEYKFNQALEKGKEYLANFDYEGALESFKKAADISNVDFKPIGGEDNKQTENKPEIPDVGKLDLSGIDKSGFNEKGKEALDGLSKAYEGLSEKAKEKGDEAKASEYFSQAEDIAKKVTNPDNLKKINKDSIIAKLGLSDNESFNKIIDSAQNVFNKIIGGIMSLFDGSKE